MKVLIVDPDWRFVRQASSYLESHAHLAVHQPSVEEALRSAQHWQPDLVVVAAELAQADLLPSLMGLQPRPAILLTGWLDRYDLAWRAWQKGGDDLLIKPVLHRDELHDAIVTAMENAVTGNRSIARAASA